MNVLVTGVTGQLGNEIKIKTDYSDTQHQYFYPTEKELDITKKEQISSFLVHNNIHYIINCAAYTNVDGAEDDEESAFLLNDKAVGYLSEACLDQNIQLIHVSTDYVFNGKHYLPYKETDEPNPEGVYGKSKLQGEQKVLRDNTGIIIRTSWLYSPFGKNFVKTIHRLAKEREELKVVYDQVGNPTHAKDLASAIVTIVDSGKALSRGQIYHFANEGVCSWYDFAKEIVTIAGIDCTITPIESKDFPTKAQRPPYSVFNKEKIKQEYGIDIPYWKDSLKKMLKKFKE
jgi:dTDP-4-dehydrorhamnose reductase